MTAINSTLSCRLLCAAECAYDIQPNLPFVKRQPYYDNMGLLADPAIITGGIDAIDAALVGINDYGIIVAFRGTLPPLPPITISILMDWLQDFIVMPEQVTGFPGTIHTGFHVAFKNLWPGVLHGIQTLRTSHPNAKIYIAGHSKGGALASLCAWQLQQQQLPGQNLTPTQVVTFASPHTGNVEFAKIYNATLSQIRYENYLDIVPFIPPEIELLALLEKIPDLSKKLAGAENWNYAPVGALQYIQENGAIEPDHAGLGAKRIDASLLDILTGRVAEVANAHSLVKYPLGYCRSVCADNLCQGNN
jgi:hypothetical protein